MQRPQKEGKRNDERDTMFHHTSTSGFSVTVEFYQSGHVVYSLNHHYDVIFLQCSTSFLSKHSHFVNYSSEYSISLLWWPYRCLSTCGIGVCIIFSHGCVLPWNTFLLSNLDLLLALLFTPG